MAKGTCMSKTLAIGVGVLTTSFVCGLVMMAVLYKTTVLDRPPVSPPPPIKPTVIPTDLPPTLRLPDNLIPEHYEVMIQPYLYTAITNNITNQSFAFKGESTVRVKCTKDSLSIFLHAQDLNVTTLEVRNSDKTQLSVSGYKIHSTESNFFEIQLKDKMFKNETYEIFTKFEGELFDGLDGFSVSRYTKVKVQDEEEDEYPERFIAASLLKPTSARKVFPCFDEPALKAVFKITIIHKPKTYALSNGRAENSDEITIDGEKWVQTPFVDTKMMSTYSLAFAVSEFEHRASTSGPKINIHARPYAIKAGYADYALEITGKILTWYENVFELKYPLPEIDQIVLPDMSVGAMENWGLISYQESGLLYDKKTGSTFDRERVATLIAHALAHQWFGNLVTMRWWNDLWLNEGFATYMSYTGVEADGWDLKDLIVLREIQTAFQVDALNSSHPLSLREHDVQTSSQITALFDDITYSKGAAVLRMLATFITEEAFMKGIKRYLADFEYNNTVYKDLLKCLQEETKEDVEGFMSTWIEQVGYPLITINTQTGITSQEHFLLKKTQGHNILWQVDIKYIEYTKNTDLSVKKIFLTLKEAKIQQFINENKEDMILANVNCSGFFRVNYDEENWNRLNMQLETNHDLIPTINRGQLIDDAFNIARAHRLNITIALNLTKYLVNETQYIPWESALKNLDHLVLMFDRSEVYGPITKYLRNLIPRLYDDFEEYTRNGTIPEKLTDQYNQVNAISVACSNGHPGCIEMAKSLFEDYKNDTNNIHPNLRKAIYCSAIATGDEDDWEFAWNKYQTAMAPAEKDKLRYALSCTKEIWLLNRYLQYTLDPSKIGKTDLVSTIIYIAKNVAGQPLAWDFVRGHWSYFTQEYGVGAMSLGSLLDAVTKRFSTAVELDELKQFQREQDEKNQGLAAQVLKQIIERTEANIEWVNENKLIVKDWFTAEL